MKVRDGLGSCRLRLALLTRSLSNRSYGARLKLETLAAIDIGSNAIRLVVGTMDEHGDIRVLKKLREPVRLGKDVFTDGSISTKTRKEALEAFVRFSAVLKNLDVKHTKAIATSALREAADRESFVQDVKKASGIKIDVIDGIEEGRLIFSAVSHRMNLNDKVALLIDIGGGSVELTVVDHGVCKATQSFKLGTVRLLQLIESKGLKEKNTREVVNEHLAPARDFLKTALKGLHVDTAVGTGGNFECLGKLRVALLQKSSIFSMTRDELGELVNHLQTMSVKERIQFLRLRPDRADVVVPAAHVTQAVMELADCDLLSIPYVGLRDGILADIGSKLPHR
jgi:exopolyphosphatase/guanosine-5'-triphosphate,3'-diphosphate pyrophosphatase